MPMHDVMNPPWPMGRWEWLELTLFWAVAIVAIALLVILLRRGRPHYRPMVMLVRGWREWPEVRLLMLALPLELLWEIAQFPLYDVWHQNDWGYILYGLAHCTLGDLLILLALYTIIALLFRNRRWFQNRIVIGGILFTALGIAYTIFSEIMNVRVKGNWGYTELMPIVPFVKIGGMPFLQWLLIPPVLLWILQLLSRQQARAVY